MQYKYYKSRSRTIRAAQWTNSDSNLQGVHEESVNGKVLYYIVTLHNQKIYLEPNDWIVQEPDHVHYYIIKPEVFENKYDLAEM